MKDLETRHNEVVVKSSDPRQLLGMYTKEDVCRKWMEDFLDEDTNEVVPIERKECIMRAGELLDKEALAKISFYMQSGDISEVVASNQKRQGREMEYNRQWPWLVRFSIGDKKKEQWLCKAKGGAMAVLQAAKDFMELRANNLFSITQVQAMNDGIIIEPEEPTEEEKCSAANAGQPLEDWQWYRLELRVDMIPENIESNNEAVFYETFIVKQATIEAAMIEVEKYMQEMEAQKRKKDPMHENRLCELAIQRAAPIKITGVIPEQFAAPYAAVE